MFADSANSPVLFHTRILRAHIAKDWREQRSALLGLACCLAVAFALTWRFGDEWIDGSFTLVGSAGSALAALLVVGVDLVPSERRGRKLTFLARQPHGMQVVFLSKLLFFAATLSAFALIGYGFARLALFGSGATPGETISSGNLYPLLPTSYFCLWVFAASCWSSRGFLAIPLGILYGTLVAWPLWPGGVLYTLNVDLIGLPGEFRTCLAVTWLSALAGTWASAVPGLANGAHRGRSGLTCLGLAILTASPVWAWSAVRWTASRSFDAAATDVRVGRAMLVEDGEYLALTASRYWSGRGPGAEYPLLVHLDTGDWRQIGTSGQGRWLEPHPWRSRFEPQAGEAISPIFLVGSSPSFENYGLPDLIDFDSLALDRLVPLQDWTFQAERRQVPGIPPQLLRKELPYGLRIRGKGQLHRYFDPERNAVYDVEELTPTLPHLKAVYPRPGLWVINGSRGRDWYLLDPESGHLEKSPHLVSADHIRGVLADGRVLLIREGQLTLHVPETGAFPPVHMPGPRTRIWFTTLLRSTEKETILRIQSADFEGLARLDTEANALSLTCPGWYRFIACDDSGRALAVEDERRVVRLSFGTGEREVLFPRREKRTTPE